jgi:hypothetical protein
MADESTYSKKLKDPRWQQKRLKIFERDGWSCQQCHSTKETLHVHHRRYLPNTEPWDYPDKLLVALCEFCHQREYDEMPQAIDGLRRAVQDAWLSIDIFLFTAAFSSANEGPDVDSSLIHSLLFAILDDPYVRRAALSAYIERFQPIEPFLSRLRAQIDADSKSIDEFFREHGIKLPTTNH